MIALINKKASIVNIINRSVGMGGNLILIMFVAIFTTPEIQGFYYTFSSLIVLQFFVELGLGTAIIQTISHAASEIEKKVLIISFLKVYVFLSFLLIAILTPSILFFKTEYSNVNNYQIEILIPWFLLSFFTGVTLFVNGCLSILEGLNKIEKVSKIRLLQSTISYLVASVILVFGGGLYSIAFIPVVQGVVGILKVVQNKEITFKNSEKNNLIYKVKWFEDIWPLQWRVAISWAAGFFVFYIYTPLIMKMDGPISAGKVGMTLQIFLAISSLSNIWISTNLPTYGKLISAGKIPKMEALFFSDVKHSLTTLLSLFFSFALLVFFFSDSLYRDRILQNNHLLMLFFTFFMNHIFFIYNFYIRSFKREILWFISILNALSTLILSIIFIPKYGVTAAVTVYFSMSAIFWILIGTPLFLMFRRKNIIQR
jgi:O-antigen/teichoic acid export membrane protein